MLRITISRATTNSFLYYLHPESVYSVGLSVRAASASKFAVGSNPWAPQEPDVNLARICERYLVEAATTRVGADLFQR